MRIKRWLVFAAIVATGSVFGWSYLRGAAPPQYQTAPVIRGDVDATVAATGTQCGGDGPSRQSGLGKYQGLLCRLQHQSVQGTTGGSHRSRNISGEGQSSAGQSGQCARRPSYCAGRGQQG